MRVAVFCRLAVAGLLVLAAAPLVPPAWAQMDSREAIGLQNQILDLRRQVQQLQDQASHGGGSYLGGGSRSSPPPSAASGDLTAQMLTRLDALEEAVRQLRGRVDELDNRVQRQNADLGKRIDDLAFQINPQGAGAGARPPGPSGVMPPVPLSGAPTSGPPPGALGTLPQPPAGEPPSTQATMRRTPEVAMQEGNAALGRHDYATAEAAAREILANRTSPRAYDAQFLLAQSQYGERQYAQAAIAYDDAYNRSKKGQHAADSLLGLANALTMINEKKAACDTVAKLRTEFPGPRPDLKDGIVAVQQRAGCH
jgi:TolA-binding protein